MKKAALRRLCGSARISYFIAPEAALPEPIELMADEAAIVADEAASMAEVAADEAAIDASEAGVDIDGVDMVDDGMVVVVEGVVIGSSFLLQAAKDTAAARVTINSAVLIFLLDFEIRTLA